MEKTKKRNKFSLIGRTLWVYVKYQIVSKLLVSILILPIFSLLMNAFITLSGRTNISSGNYKDFFFSLYGIPVIILAVLLLIFIMGMDINTFIIISSLIEEGKVNFKVKAIIKEAFKSLKHFFSPLGVLIVLYSAIILPIIGSKIKMGPMSNFKIPNFISSVIYNNPLYTAIYGITITILVIVTFIYIFSLHFILIEDKKLIDGFKASRKLMQKYWKKFIKDYLIKLLKLLLLVTIIGGILILIVLLIDLGLSRFYANENISFILMYMSILEIFAFVAFISAPIIIGFITELFYKYQKEEGFNPSIKLVKSATFLSDEQIYNKIKKKTKLELVLVLIFIIIINWGTASIMEDNFNELFKSKVSIEMVAHRGGGDLDAENTVEGIAKVAKEGAAWTEIDVQRTKDGYYIINHDASFARISGVDKKPMEMTLEEIRKLKVANEFDPSMPKRKVSTFEEILDASRENNIGVFVELKGASADQKMVDDVVKIIEDKGMLDKCVILSLDYSIIEYTSENYPQIKTGFLYFFTTGNLADLKGDYLIMEEGEATPDKIDEIHAAGKKAVVWTVNTDESVEKFVRSNVDGIITDYILKVKDGIEKANKRSKIEIIMDSFK